jgi:hypothetical protein
MEQKESSCAPEFAAETAAATEMLPAVLETLLQSHIPGSPLDVGRCSSHRFVATWLLTPGQHGRHSFGLHPAGTFNLTQSVIQILFAPLSPPALGIFD